MSKLIPFAGLAGALATKKARSLVSFGSNFVKSKIGIERTGANSAKFTQSSSTRKDTTILTYPLNVENDKQQGHHIMFHIYKKIEGKLAQNKEENMATAWDAMELEGRMAQDEYTFARRGDFLNRGTSQRDPGRGVNESGIYSLVDAPTKLNSILNSATSKTQKSIQQENLGVRQHQATIALYMPPAVQVEYEVSYADKKIGTVAGFFNDAIAAFSGTSGNMATKLNAMVDKSGTSLKELAVGFATGALDTFAPGAQTLLEINRGTVITPRMELMFEGVGRRNFTYTFNFMPKSEQEAKIIDEIIYKFKLHSMPEYINNSTRREMRIPDTFEIDYMYLNKENNFINKINTCFLKNVAVEYGADRFTAHEETTNRFGDGMPSQKTKLTLQFSELETLSRGLIEQGF